MRAALWLAWRDLGTYRWQGVAMGAVLAIAVLAFVALGSYRQALETDYAAPSAAFLVVQQDQSFAEFYGSRVPPETAGVLASGWGLDPIPEIHAVVGTSLQDAILLRGVDVDRYNQLDPVAVVTGRGLTSGDTPRRAMIGVRLADRLGAGPGDVIQLRGRPFDVVGVFQTGTYTENEAWVPLAGAQQLLGWGEDVSLYVIPDDGSLNPGDRPGPGLSVVRRGELWSTFPRQWQGLLAQIQVVTQAIGLAAALSLAAMLWRLAWRRRWQVAVLRSLGFGRGMSVGYLGAQGAVIALAGGLAGTLGAEVLLQAVRLTLAGVSLRPQISLPILISTALWLGLLTLISVLAPTWVLGRRRVAELMAAA